MLESKYESHIENSLLILIDFYEIISGFMEETEKVKSLKKSLKEIGKGKRILKLSQQTKKKKLF